MNFTTFLQIYFQKIIQRSKVQLLRTIGPSRVGFFEENRQEKSVIWRVMTEQRLFKGKI